MPSQLEQLRTMTDVVADTGDISAIDTFRPLDATTNPSLLFKAAQLPAYGELLNQAKALGQGYQGDANKGAALHLGVLIGLEILNLIPGRISTEVDARLSYDTKATIEEARTLIKLYNDAGVANDRVLIKIASTYEGIQAAKVLEQEGVNTNLTLLFSQAQAVAAAEAGAYLISPFVGRILDWFKARNPDADYAGVNDPGVQSVTSIYNYFKQHGHDTIVMGASFRNIGEIQALAGCDRLTISPALLEELSATDAPLPQVLSAQSTGEPQAKIEMNEVIFRTAMNADAMATEKLAEGIRGFIADQDKLEALLSNV